MVELLTTQNLKYAPDYTLLFVRVYKPKQLKITSSI